MTVERRRELYAELEAIADRILGLGPIVRRAVEASDSEAIDAARVLLQRDVERVDELLLEIAADQLADERSRRRDKGPGR